MEQQGGSQCWEKKLQVLLVLSAKQRVSPRRAGVGSAQAEYSDCLIRTRVLQGAPPLVKGPSAIQAAGFDGREELRGVKPGPISGEDT